MLNNWRKTKSQSNIEIANKRSISIPSLWLTTKYLRMELDITLV